MHGNPIGPYNNSARLMIIVSILVLMIGGLPSTLFLFAQAQEENGEAETVLYILDYNIEDYGTGKWRYGTTTNDYEVCFAKNSEKRTAKIQTLNNSYKFTLKPRDVYVQSNSTNATIPGINK